MKNIAKRHLVFWTAIILGGTAMLSAEVRLVSYRAESAMVIPSTAKSYDFLPVEMTSAMASAAVAERNRELATTLLVDAIVQIESGGRPNMVGSCGERGLMQIKRGTWSDMTSSVFGGRVHFDEAFDPDLNRRIGTAYLAFLHDFLQRHRSEWKADERSLLLACYNAGPSRVLSSGFSLNRLPSQTRDYVRRASALHESYLANHNMTLAGQFAAAAPAVRASNS